MTLEDKVHETIENVNTLVDRVFINLDNNDNKNVVKNLKKTQQELDLLKRFFKIPDTCNELPKTIQELKEGYEDICNKFYKQGNYALFGKHKTDEYNHLRRCFFEMGHKHYYTTSTALGRIANKHHATVLYHLKNVDMIDRGFEDVKEVLKQHNLYY